MYSEPSFYVNSYEFVHTANSVTPNFSNSTIQLSPIVRNVIGFQSVKSARRGRPAPSRCKSPLFGNITATFCVILFSPPHLLLCHQSGNLVAYKQSQRARTALYGTPAHSLSATFRYINKHTLGRRARQETSTTAFAGQGGGVTSRRKANREGKRTAAKRPGQGGTDDKAPGATAEKASRAGNEHRWGVRRWLLR